MELITIIWASIGIILAIMIPGTVISFAIFPKRNDLEFVNRLGISIVLGFIPYVFLYLFEKGFYTHINFLTVISTILGLTMLGVMGWYVRKENVKKN